MPAAAYCTALAPLLGEGTHRRSFCLILEPLGPRQAERVVMRERTARHVAIRMRQRTGQIVPGLAGFITAGALVAAVLAAAAVLSVRWAGARRPHRGMATHGQLKSALSESAVIARAWMLRPSLAACRAIKVTDAGVRAGVSIPARTKLAVSAEDSVLVVAAPRQGKTSQVVIPWLHEWPGAALVTSLRLDVLLNTIIPRSRQGPPGDGTHRDDQLARHVHLVLGIRLRVL